MTSSVTKPFGGKLGWRLAVAALIGLWSWPLDLAAARTITDSAGRQVENPDSIARVHAAGPPASVLPYALAPQRMIGWLRAPRDSQKPFLLPAARMLPTIGRLQSRADLERLAGDKPDLILDFGAVNDNYRTLANRVQAETGIPYLLVDGRLEATPNALRLLGGVIADPRAGRFLPCASSWLLPRGKSLGSSRLCEGDHIPTTLTRLAGSPLTIFVRAMWCSTTSQIGGPSTASLVQAHPVTTYSLFAWTGWPVLSTNISEMRWPAGLVGSMV